jgi:hypothetical protein
MRRQSHIVIAASLVLGALGSSCAGEEAVADQPAVVAETTEAPAAQAPATNVAKIVFVDKKDACECTRERADGSWAALQSALGGREDIPVERIYADTEPEKVAPYKEMRSFMVIPAIYVLDASGALLDRLQGEITSERFAKALK